MGKYEDLIKRLRDSEHEIDCSLCDRDCCYPDGKVHSKCIIIEASDAIEEMNRRIGRAIELYNRNVEKSAMYEALAGISPEPPKEE